MVTGQTQLNSGGSTHEPGIISKGEPIRVANKGLASQAKGGPAALVEADEKNRILTEMNNRLKTKLIEMVKAFDIAQKSNASQS